MEKIPCSVGILTFNSGKTLERALESVKEFDDLIICDGGSTDETLSIAERFGAQIISQDPSFQNADGTLKDYAGVRNQSLEAARHEWFFYLDSDEAASPELVAEICMLITSGLPKQLVYNISPRIVLDGKVIEHSSNYPGWQKRFFNRTTGAYFRKPVHERIEYDAERFDAGFLKGHWFYFISSKVDYGRMHKYARMEAERYATRATLPFLQLVFRKLSVALKTFVKTTLIYLRYGFKGSLPPSLEFSRVHYQLSCIRFLAKEYLKGTDRHE